MIHLKHIELGKKLKALADKGVGGIVEFSKPFANFGTKK